MRYCKGAGPAPGPRDRGSVLPGGGDPSTGRPVLIFGLMAVGSGRVADRSGPDTPLAGRHD